MEIEVLRRYPDEASTACHAVRGSEAGAGADIFQRCVQPLPAGELELSEVDPERETAGAGS